MSFIRPEHYKEKFYNEEVERSKKAFQTLSMDEQREWKKIFREGVADIGVRFMILMHICYDFAQTVFIPHFVRNPGSIYFFVPLKCRILGMGCESARMQINYLMPEGEYAFDSSDWVLPREEEALAVPDEPQQPQVVEGVAETKDGGKGEGEDADAKKLNVFHQCWEVSFCWRHPLYVL